MRLVQTSLLLVVLALLPPTVFAGSPDWSERALKRIENPPLGLPSVVQPDNNMATSGKIKLGHKLFFDRRLSGNGSMSCAMCHLPAQGFGNNELATPIGIKGRSLTRNAPSIFNVAYHRTMFHDGRDTSLETQVYGPFLATAEMANPSIGWLLQTIGGLEDYWGKFEKVFGAPVNPKNLGEAIAAYERTVLSANSRFDKWKFGNQPNALTAQEIKGWNLFKGKAKCTRCHGVKKDSALFTDHKFHNTGIGAKGNDDALKKDLGRMGVTDELRDRYRFKTPILRNIALTGPYMHDGSLTTLTDVVNFYNHGTSKQLKPLRLSTKEVAAVVAFLTSLTGDNVDELIAESRSN